VAERVSPKRYSPQLLGTSRRPWQGGDSQDSTPPAKEPQSKTPQGSVASYMGPDQGPFECDDCQFFNDPSGCTKEEVIQELGDQGDGTAQVDPKGCCNFFEKK
jgi:hypothetical protein